MNNITGELVICSNAEICKNPCFHKKEHFKKQECCNNTTCINKVPIYWINNMNGYVSFNCKSLL